MQAPIKQLFEKAYGNYGIGAFNVFNAEQILAVFKGGNRCNIPIIVQITPVALDYLGQDLLQDCIRSVSNLFPKVEFCIHLDHGTMERCEEAIRSDGFDSVMIDASHEEFNENIRITGEVVKMAHAKGIAVEAELGVLCGTEDAVTVDKEQELFTDPQQAKEFVKLTQCDSLAVSVGTSHGAYKFSGGKGLQLDILASIGQLLPGFPLVLHGASAVPSNEIERINLAGGDIRSGAMGTDRDQLLQAIRLGVCKINIATDLRLIWTRVHREFFSKLPGQFDPVIPGKTYMEELENFIAKKCCDLIVPK